MILRARAAALPLLAALSVSAPAAATTGSVFGIGPRTRAWAGAGITQELGYEAAFANPAALSASHEASLSAGYGVSSAWLYLERQGDTKRRFDTQNVGETELGFTLPLWVAEQRFVLGFASSSPGGSLSRAALPLAEEPQFPLLQSRQQALDFDLGLGVRPWPFLSLGLGLRALSTLSGSAEVVRGKKSSSTQVGDTLEPVLAPVAGVSAYFTWHAVLSLVVRAPLRADFAVKLAAVDLGATQLPPLNLAGVAHYDPLTVQVEYAHGVGPLEGLFGVVYQRFRDTPTLLPRTVSCPPERPACSALDAESPHFHDTFDLHAAATLRLPLARAAQARLRAGYAFVPSPVPEQTAAENLLDNARHRFGLGYGVTLTNPLPPLEVDAAFTLDELVTRTSRKRPEVSPDNAGAPALTTNGRIFGLSLGLTVRL
jgi:hypothetical protein